MITPVFALSLFDQLGTAVVLGITFGAVYSLIALGIVLVYRASGIFNFAQGEFGTVALFAAYSGVQYWGWSYGWGLLFGLGVALAMGLAAERLVIWPLRHSPQVTLLVATAGVALAAIGFEFWQFNENPILTMPRIVEGVAWFSPFGVGVTWQQVITLGVLLAVAVLLAAFFRSPLGLAVQAASQDPVASELVGVSVRRVSRLTWALAALLGGLAGLLSGPNATFTAAFLTFGAGRALLPGFTAAVLAGMRSMPGALVGGLVVGIVEGLGGLTAFAAVPGARELMLFALLLVALLVRPSGLFVRRAVAA
ncbi:MAG: branched-chain amino acid ABC transporter permease [Acidimicrobiales bacterium]